MIIFECDKCRKKNVCKKMELPPYWEITDNDKLLCKECFQNRSMKK